MDNDKVVELLLDVKDRMVRVETKLDAYNGLCQKLDRLEGRIVAIENAPAKDVGLLKGSIINAIGLIIGGAIVAALAFFIKK